MKSDILGVLVDDITPEETLEKIEQFVQSGRRHYIVTPNPEIVMEAQKDGEFREILNSADIAIPDGTGLIFASRLSGRPLRKRTTGSDLTWKVAELAEEKGYSLYLLGGEIEGVATKAAEKLKDKFPGLKISGAEEGGKISRQGEAEDKGISGRINEAGPDILLVAFGAPRQEKWIYKNLPDLDSVKVAIGIGGTFDFIAGKAKRAPKAFRSLGLEWLWRLITQPQRIGRIWTATGKFSWAVAKFKLSGKK